MAYALAVCNGGIFAEKEDIWHQELVAGRGLFARHLLPEKPNRHCNSRPRLMQRLREVVRTGDLENEWIDSKQERDEAFQKNSNQKEIANEIREEVRNRLGGSAPKKSDLERYPFSQFRKTEIDRTGRHLMTLVDLRRAPRLAEHMGGCSRLERY